MIKLCCIFNYAPHYRLSIYNKIDNEFDAQFYFSDMESDIVKIDYSKFKRYPNTVRDRKIFGKLLWRKDILMLPFKNFQHYLIIGDFSLSYFPFIILCHILGKKVYAWGHGSKSFTGKLKWYIKWFYHNCDIFFTYSEGGKQRLMDLGVPSNRLQVIYNSLNEGVDITTQKQLNSTLFQDYFNNNHPTLLFVGRLTKIKRLDWIIKCQSYHRSKGINYNLVIIGDGPEKHYLEDLSSKNNLEKHIWFYGSCYNDDELSTLIYNSDLCVSPGNVGLTALHSMSYGTPVISNDDFETQMPEYETIIRGKTGDLYKKDDFDNFCSCIEGWITSKNDREQIRYNCYSIINDKFNSNYQIKLLKEIIR